MAQHEDVRRREYFLLAGTLFRFYQLYGQAPPPDSWVYQWFPDGDLWRDAVQKHGNESVAVVTSAALQEEVQSGRNRYTADNSVKPGAKKATGVKGVVAKKMATAKKGVKGMKKGG